ncbi:MAG: hypothetical protein U0869_01980 [Chloroflexota bacterium]
MSATAETMREQVRDEQQRHDRRQLRRVVGARAGELADADAPERAQRARQQEADPQTQQPGAARPASGTAGLARQVGDGRGGHHEFANGTNHRAMMPISPRVAADPSAPGSPSVTFQLHAR